MKNLIKNKINRARVPIVNETEIVNGIFKFHSPSTALKAEWRSSKLAEVGGRLGGQQRQGGKDSQEDEDGRRGNLWDYQAKTAGL